MHHYPVKLVREFSPILQGVFSDTVNTYEQVTGQPVSLTIIKSDYIGKIIVLKIFLIHIQDIVVRTENYGYITYTTYLAFRNNLKPSVIQCPTLENKISIFEIIRYHKRNNFLQIYKMYKKFEIKIILSNFTGQNGNIKTTIDMEIKKTEKANLENKKLLFTEIGLIVSLLIVFIAFEWTQEEVKVSNLEDTTQVITEEEIIPITQETPPPPPSAPKIPILSDQIDIVDDEIELDDDMFMNLEDDASLGVEIMDYVEVSEEVVEEEAIPFQLVEEKPSFQGGDANQFSKWVNSRLVYPEIAKENGVQGRVTLQFTVEKDGTVSKVKVLRGVDPSLDKEAVRVVSMSPKWKPGKQRDRAVPVTYTFPVIFQLR